MRKDDIRRIDRIVKQEKLSRQQRRMLHDEITGQKLTMAEIREIAREIKRLYPNK
jgi:hemolysin activation/secretion protein